MTVVHGQVSSSTEYIARAKCYAELINSYHYHVVQIASHTRDPLVQS